MMNQTDATEIDFSDVNKRIIREQIFHPGMCNPIRVVVRSFTRPLD
jgi:hypothetical protein